MWWARHGRQFSPNCYTEWSEIDVNRDTMAKRLRVAHITIGIPVFQPWTAATAPVTKDEEIEDPIYVPSAIEADSPQQPGKPQR